MDRARSTQTFSIVVAIAAAALFAPSPTAADEAVYFGYDFNEGYSQRHEANYSQEMSRGTYNWSLIFDLEVTEKCVGLTEDGLFKMEIVFDKVEASVMMFDQMRETHIGEQLTGQAISFKLDKNGEYSDIKSMGYIESWQQIQDTIEGFVDAFYVELPAEGYAEGGSWESGGERERGGVTSIWRAEYEFKEMKKEADRECAKVEIESDVDISGVVETPGGDFETDGEGEGKSELYFDPSVGLVVKLKSKMDIELNQTPSSGGDATEMAIMWEIERKLL